MKKLKVAVIYGGPSKEHEISLKTGEAMLNGLDTTKYTAIPVFISKKNQWRIANQSFLAQDQAILSLKKLVDICLIGLHGTYGEDGQIQSLLERHQLLYTGSNSIASKLAMTKHRASQIYKDAGLHTPIEMVITKWKPSLLNVINKKFTLPVVIKPESQGSSVGVSIVDTIEKIESAIHLAFKEDETVLVQQYINGREVSCGVLEVNDGLIALPPTEVVPLQTQFYDYHAKYTVGATKEVTPPENMGLSDIETIKDTALIAHKILGCSGYSRTDIIINQEKIYVIETNTLPGMTITSFLPQQVAAMGMAFSELLDIIIQAALKKG